MVRQRPRKSVEELYGTKYEATPPKAQAIHGNISKAMRNERDFNGYIISSSTAYNTTCGQPINIASNMTGTTTARRRTGTGTARPTKPETKFYGKNEKHLDMDDKRDQTAKPKTSRCPEKGTYNSSPTIYDNKNYINFIETSQKDKQQNGHHHHPHHSPQRADDDKEDDTEEFFELIRATVENAIGKSISDLLNRNFRELSAKVDRFSSELKATNALLNKLQTDVNNKVVHYGEENSRHFRYLCMKSEYDKMFYQHHSMLASTSSPTDKRPSLPKTVIPTDCEKVPNPCSCRKAQGTEPQKVSSDERSVSNKSSEMGMREVLEHIQRFCNQMQINDDRLPKGGYRMEDALKLNKQMFEEDDDDFQMSSDGMTPRSDEHVHNYGASTMRATARGGNGGGDA